jgi:ADP-ribose pyrophosphatase
MPSYSHEDTLARYLELLARRPELGQDPPGAGIELLTDPGMIEHAREAARLTRGAHGQDTADTRVGVLASDPYMTVLRDAVRFGNGTYGLYNRIFENACVAVLPLLEGRAVIIRVFRHGLRQWSLEFPRGGVEPDETHEQAARRELREEIGANASELIDTGEFTPGGSALAIRARLYVARIDEVRHVDRAESISEATPVSTARLETLIRDGEIIDGFSLALFARARLLGLL